MIVQQLVNGLSQGSIYAVVGLGLTLIYGLLGIANFAQGQFLLVGAYTAVVCTQHGLSVYVALPLALVMGWIAGAAVEWLAFRPVEREHFKGLLVSVGVNAVGLALFFEAFGPATYSVPDIAGNAVWHLGSIALIADRLVLLVFALVVFAIVGSLLRFTKIGHAVRAAAENRDAALLAGVPMRVVLNGCFAFGAATTAVLGVVMAGTFSVTPALADAPLLLGFVAMIVGGPASPAGALVGGLIVGELQALSAGYISSSFQDALAYAMVLAVLFVRPRGLFAAAQVERALCTHDDWSSKERRSQSRLWQGVLPWERMVTSSPWPR